MFCFVRTQHLLAVLRTQKIDKLTIRHSNADATALCFELDCGKTGKEGLPRLSPPRSRLSCPPNARP